MQTPEPRRWSRYGVAVFGLAALVASAAACDPTGPVVPVDPAPAPTTTVSRSTVPAPTTTTTKATTTTTKPPTTTTTQPSCTTSSSGCIEGFTARTQTCLAAPPTSAADYQRAFDDRRVWAGGDVGKTVALPDGRTLWLFGDTLTGLSRTGGMAGPMLRNSLVVQKGACFTFVHGGTAAAPTTPLPASAPNSWLWPTSATVDAANNAVHIVGVRMQDDPGSMFGWRIAGADVATLRASDLKLLSIKPAPVPQDGRVTWNGSAITTGGYTYMYAFVKDHQIVARTTPATLATTPWEYFDGSGWTTDITRARQPQIQNAPAAEFTIIPHKGGFLASAKRAEMNSDDVSTWFATSPIGPWTYQGRAAYTAGEGTAYITYAGHVVPLPGAGLVTVWSQNGRYGDPNFDFRNYGPKFAAPLAGSVP